MAVPTYSVIPDSDIDPESPITTSLMTRLRDNFLAVLGLDNTASNPVFVIPASYIAPIAGTYSSGDVTCTTTAGTAASSEFDFSDATFPGERWSFVFSFSAAGGGGDGTSVPYNASGVEICPVYTAGVCTSIRVLVLSSSGFAEVVDYDVTVAVDNAYHTLFTKVVSSGGSFNVKLNLKARVVSGVTKITWQIVATGSTATATVHSLTKRFKLYSKT